MLTMIVAVRVQFALSTFSTYIRVKQRKRVIGGTALARPD